MLAACVAVLGDRPGLLRDRQLRAPARRGPRHRRRGPVRLPAADRAGHQPGTARASPPSTSFRLAPLPLPGPRRELPGISPGSRPSRSSSTGPPGSGPARRRRRPSCAWSPTSSAGSTACRWPSSSPPAGCPRFSFADLHRRLDRSLDLLGGGRPSGDARHRTLRATVEWSYQLLAEDERRLFRHLAVFVDGVDLDAAERLAADLGLASDPGSRAGPPGRRLDDRGRPSRAGPATGCSRRCGRSGSTGWPRPARTTARPGACCAGRWS